MTFLFSKETFIYSDELASGMPRGCLELSELVLSINTQLKSHLRQSKFAILADLSVQIIYELAQDVLTIKHP